MLAAYCERMAPGDEEVAAEMMMAVSTVFDHIVAQGWQSNVGEVTLTCNLYDHALLVELRYAGGPIDWCSDGGELLGAPSWQVCVSGLMDFVGYQHMSGVNQVQMTKRIGARPLHVCAADCDCRDKIDKVVMDAKQLGCPAAMLHWLQGYQSGAEAWAACDEPLWALLLSELLGSPRVWQIAAVSRCISPPERGAGAQGYNALSALRRALLECQMSGFARPALATFRWSYLREVMKERGVSEAVERRRILAALGPVLQQLERAARRPSLASAVWPVVAVLQWSLLQYESRLIRRAVARMIRRVVTPVRIAGRVRVGG